MGPGGIQTLIQDNNTTPNVSLTTTSTALDLVLPGSVTANIAVDGTGNLLNVSTN